MTQTKTMIGSGEVGSERAGGHLGLDGAAGGGVMPERVPDNDADLEGGAPRNGSSAREPMEPREPLEQRAQPRRIEPRRTDPPPRWQPAYYGAPPPASEPAPGLTGDPHPLFTHDGPHRDRSRSGPGAGAATGAYSGADTPAAVAGADARGDAPQPRTEWRSRAPLGALSVGLILMLGLTGAVVVALRAQESAQTPAPDAAAPPTVAPEASAPAPGQAPVIAPPAQELPGVAAPSGRPGSSSSAPGMPSVAAAPGLPSLLLDLPSTVPHRATSHLPAVPRLPAGSGSGVGPLRQGVPTGKPTPGLRAPGGVGERLPEPSVAGGVTRDLDEDRDDENSDGDESTSEHHDAPRTSANLLDVLDALDGGLGLG